MIIASYPTETRKDYDDAYSWFEQYKQYAGNVITRVQMTIPAILDGTRLKKNTNIKKFIAERDKRKTHANALKEKAIECGFQVETYW